jgi:cell fate (sporulation/competence/biofilm development) regulator YlbF (YheA/YmcA/DUF963 family)
MIDLIISHTFDLKDALETHPWVADLSLKEKNLDDNQDIKWLARQYQEAQENYQYFWTINPDNLETVEAQKKLSEIKLKVDSHPAVLAYVQQYALVRKLYDLVNLELFKPFKHAHLGCKV